MNTVSKKTSNSQKSQILEGSRAISQTITAIKPAVVSAYPITPQTHIVEDLAKIKAEGKADFEYIRAESEFAAASIVLGASATGVRVYSATSSQGLLLMTEVIFNIAGMRLPVVLTCANRAISAPISIWNDHQDAMTVRDAGWIMLFAEDNQEAVEQHILAYKLAEQLNLPVMINVDGFILTHSYEPVTIPTRNDIKKFLKDYKPKGGEFLDPKNPATFGALATPAFYMEIRKDLNDDLALSAKTINKEWLSLRETIPHAVKSNEKATKMNSGLLEYYGPTNPKTIIIAMGSVVGTIKDVIDEKGKKPFSFSGVGVVKIKSYRPFPTEELAKIAKNVKNIAVLDKSISLGFSGPLNADVKAALYGKTKAKIQGFVAGIGGRDITKDIIKRMIDQVGKKGDENIFMLN